MVKSATINIRVDPAVKSDAEGVFSSLGMTLSEAINVFLHKSVIERGLPFDVKQPRYNAATETAMQEAHDIMSGKVKTDIYATVDDMLASLDQ